MTRHTRRDLLRLACCSAAGASMVGGLSKLGLVSALAQGTSGYKALVCIFMFGGNDSNNMLVPIDSRYTQYLQSRSVLALPQSQLLPLQVNGQSIYGLHPNMPEMQGYFNNQKALAILANVGTLVQPTTQAEFNASTNLPENLFSHSDQQNQWQSAQLAGTPASGWAGKVADNVQTFNASAQFPPILSISGSPVFCTGITTRPFSMDPGNPPGLDGFDTSTVSQARYAATQQLLTFDSGLSMVQAANAVTGQAVKFATVLSSALKSIPPLMTQFPGSYLGQQLQQVAQVISARSALGVQRQIFFCSVGGFDTHSDQLPQQVALLSDVSKSMSSFYQATQELGVANQVTQFTLSEFSRTMEPGSSGGSDHAWGSHQMILGGAVQGNAIYGTFPTLALGGPNDADQNGRWIPTTALDQYAATLATWFGVSAANLPSIFSNLTNFPTSNLGFLG
jgi:uncharacterized protein (DUF1501 family)